jgi:ABC-type glycerol-3-phosphate transport system substrate-binding protein
VNGFIALHPGLRIDVRVKAESGENGLVDALAITKLAAPSVMPDLVALSRPDLESATAKGLLQTLDGLTDLPAESDWYPFARQMGTIQNSTVGLPFAGDALALVGYRAPLPTSWLDIPEDTLFIFPAADPQALFTLTLYLSAGGTLQDNQGHLTLDEAVLANVLSLYTDSTETDFLTSQVTNYETNEQAWDAFREQRGNLVVSWISRYLNEDSVPLALASLPGLDTGQYTLATGWSWALAGSSPENQPLAVDLAKFLSDDLYLAEWTQAAGYLPTRPSTLSSWEDASLQLTLAQTAESAVLVPGKDLISTVGPIFTEAVLSVLKGTQSPTDAAATAVKKTK